MNEGGTDQIRVNRRQFILLFTEQKEGIANPQSSNSYEEL